MSNDFTSGPTVVVTNPEPTIVGELDAPMLPAGERFAGRYVVEAPLGRGGFGEVYRVRDTRNDGRPLALKMHRLARGNRFALETIQGEFALLAGLSHPNLATVHDFGFVGDDVAFFTQTFVPGVGLGAIDVRIDSPRGVALVAQLCRALDFLHARGVLHRDVKPSNVLVDLETDHLVLLDFGIARAFGTLDGRVHAGTTGYLAPEAIGGGAMDGRADLYSLGVTFYRLLAGEPPFRGDAYEVMLGHVAHEPPPLPAHVAPCVAALVMRLLRKEPSERHASAREVLAELSAAVGAAAPLDTGETLASYVLSPRWIGDGARLDALVDEATRAAPGEAPLLVVGDAGTGKSRLLRELRQRVQLAGRSFVHVDAGRDALYEIASAVLTPDVVLRLPDEERIELARAMPELRRRGERIAVALDVERARVRRIETLARAIRDRFAVRPGVLGIDDLQWVEPRELESLEALLAAVRANRARCVVVLASRPSEAVDDLASRLGARWMSCADLSPDASRLLVASMFGSVEAIEGTAFGAALAAGSHAALWVQESLRLALESGRVVRRGGTWVRDGDVPAHDLGRVLRARVDALGDDARCAALGAAVLDRPSSVAEIAAAAGFALDRVGPAMQQLVGRGLVEDRRDARGLAVYAMHDRFIDAVVDAHDEAAVGSARARAGRWLAKRGGRDPRALAAAGELLARAGHLEEAAEVFARAAASADGAGRPDHAVRFVHREIALRDSIGERTTPCFVRVHDLALKAGMTDVAVAALASMRGGHRPSRRARVARPPRDEREAGGAESVAIALRVARDHLRRGEPREARRIVRTALGRARRLGLITVEAELALLSAQIDIAHGDLGAALRSAKRAAASARELRDPGLEARALLEAGLAATRQGKTAAVRGIAQRAARAAEAAGDRTLQSEALRQLGNVERETGMTARALATYRRAVSVARDSGSTESEAKALNNVGSTAHLRGFVAEALEAWRRSIELKERMGAPGSAVLTYANVGSLLTNLGRHDEAREALASALAGARGDTRVAALAHSNLADLHVVAGDLDAALTEYRAANVLFAEYGWDALRGHALTGVARVLLVRGDPGDLEAAASAVSVIARIAAANEMPESIRRVHTTGALLAEAQGDVETALDRARRGAALARREVHTSFSDVFASGVEARWILALVLHRNRRAPAAAREVVRARALLATCERALPTREDRLRFVERHPLHRAIVRGELVDRVGCAWDEASMWREPSGG